ARRPGVPGLRLAGGHGPGAAGGVGASRGGRAGLPRDRGQAVPETAGQVGGVLGQGGRRLAPAGSAAVYAHGGTGGLRQDVGFPPHLPRPPSAGPSGGDRRSPWERARLTLRQPHSPPLPMGATGPAPAAPFAFSAAAADGPLPSVRTASCVNCPPGTPVLSILSA